MKEVTETTIEETETIEEETVETVETENGHWGWFIAAAIMCLLTFWLGYVIRSATLQNDHIVCDVCSSIIPYGSYNTEILHNANELEQYQVRQIWQGKNK